MNSENTSHTAHNSLYNIYKMGQKQDSVKPKPPFKGFQ